MEDYILKGHATKLNQTESKKTSRITNYIPHHAATNVKKLNKVQIVNDAGAKAQGIWLNEHLLKGSDFLNNLDGVLLKFRERQFVIIGDITQMFHQVHVLPADRDALKFLWRFSKDSDDDPHNIRDNHARASSSHLFHSPRNLELRHFLESKAVATS